MDHETPLHWALYEYWCGNKKEALDILVGFMKEFEIVKKMEKLQEKKGTGLVQQNEDHDG